MTIDEKTRLTAAKIRSLIYYRLTIDETLWEVRHRCQYIHQIRGLRETILEFWPELPDDSSRSWWKGVLDLIPVKTKAEECKEVIEKLRDYVER